MPTTINGKSTKPMPASVTAVMKRGVPKATAQAEGPKPRGTVKVG